MVIIVPKIVVGPHLRNRLIIREITVLLLTMAYRILFQSGAKFITLIIKGQLQELEADTPSMIYSQKNVSLQEEENLLMMKSDLSGILEAIIATLKVILKDGFHALVIIK